MSQISKTIIRIKWYDNHKEKRKSTRKIEDISKAIDLKTSQTPLAQITQNHISQDLKHQMNAAFHLIP